MVSEVKGLCRHHGLPPPNKKMSYPEPNLLNQNPPTKKGRVARTGAFSHVRSEGVRAAPECRNAAQADKNRLWELKLAKNPQDTSKISKKFVFKKNRGDSSESPHVRKDIFCPCPKFN